LAAVDALGGHGARKKQIVCPEKETGPGTREMPSPVEFVSRSKKLSQPEQPPSPAAAAARP